MSRLLAFGAAASIATLVVLAACVGDDANVNGSSGGTSGSSGSTPVEGGSSGADGSPSSCKGDTVEACGASCTKCTAPTGGTVECTNGACQQKCTAATTLCGSACIDLESSPTDCGKCGHSCNGGACTTHTCGPIDVASGFTEVSSIAASSMGIVMVVNGSDVKRCGIPTGCSAATLSDISTGSNNLNRVAVAGSEVFWDGAPSDPWIVWHCPLTGCPGAGPTVAESNNDTFGALVAGPNDVYWAISGYYAQYSHRCKPPACSTLTDVRPYSNTGNQYNSTLTPTHEMSIPTTIASVGAVTVLWNTGGLYNSGTKFLRSCALATTCTTPTEIDTAPTYGVSALTYYNGQHYGASGGSIFSVPDVAGATTRTALAPDAAGIVGMAVDASGIYWVNGTSGNVRRCAKLTGCAAGEVETLATGQTGAKAIAIDAANVYWAMPTKVMRVVK
jgi:hypothetical protein